MLQLEKKHCLFLSVGTEIEIHTYRDTHTHLFQCVESALSIQTEYTSS